MEGTITWFECSKELPPKDPAAFFGYSVEVLATDRIKIEHTVYCHNPISGEPYWHTHNGLTPTHWAYINFPK